MQSINYKFIVNYKNNIIVLHNIEKREKKYLTILPPT